MIMRQRDPEMVADCRFDVCPNIKQTTDTDFSTLFLPFPNVEKRSCEMDVRRGRKINEAKASNDQ